MCFILPIKTIWTWATLIGSELTLWRTSHWREISNRSRANDLWIYKQRASLWLGCTLPFVVERTARRFRCAFLKTTPTTPCIWASFLKITPSRVVFRVFFFKSPLRALFFGRFFPNHPFARCFSGDFPKDYVFIPLFALKNLVCIKLPFIFVSV